MAPSNNKYLEKIKGDVSLHRERGAQKGGGFEGIPWLEDEEWAVSYTHLRAHET